MTSSTLDFAPAWEIAKGVMLTGVTAGVGWMIRKLNAIDARQVNHQHILVGVDGNNGLRSDVKQLIVRVDDIEDSNIRREAEAAAERRHGPHDRREPG